jgi:hypothetical protein
LASLSLVDEIEQQSLSLRPRERERGLATRLRTEALAAARACQDRAELQARREAILTPLRTAPRDHGRRVFGLALLGDAYSISEPFFNMNLEQQLGYMGVEVERWFWLSKSIRFPILERVRYHSENQAREEAVDRYLGRDVGGFALPSVKEAVAFEYISHNGGDTRFKGFAASETDLATRSFECQGCSNLCQVVEIRVGREVLARWGGRCGKWDM